MSKSVEQEEFEKWVCDSGREHMLELNHHGHYKDLLIVAWWSAWQARGKALSIQQEADAEDAVRYRWLKTIGNEQVKVFGHYAGEQLDQAINAAMATPTDSEDK